MRIGSHNLGLQLDGFSATELTKQRLQSVNYQTYPEQYAHLLVHALQFNIKIPSINLMKKTEQKNKGQKKGQKPQEPKKIPHGRKMMPKFQRSVSSTEEPKNNSSQPYKIHSPEQIALKSERLQFIQHIKNWKQEIMISEQPPKQEAPLYFKKKRASHRRRINQRRQLIKLNRDKLVEIFGAKILGKKATIGRQEIRIALGIEIKVAEPQAINEFMKMAEENNK